MIFSWYFLIFVDLDGQVSQSPLLSCVVETGTGPCDSVSGIGTLTGRVTLLEKLQQLLEILFLNG